MKLSPEMIEARLPDLLQAARREAAPLGPARIACGPITGAQAPDYDDAAWERLDVGDRWGGPGLTCWLRVPVRVPRAWVGSKVAVHIVLGDYHLSGPEALAYLDGVPVQGFDFYHRELVLGDAGRFAGARPPAACAGTGLPRARPAASPLRRLPALRPRGA